MSHHDLLVRAIMNERVREADTARRSLAMRPARGESPLRRTRRERWRLRTA